MAQDRAVKDERKAIKAAKRTTKDVAVNDSYQNFMLNLGMGTDNALSASTYGFNPITRVRTLLEWIHRGSWLGGVAIDIIPGDMTRGGIDLQSTTPPDDIEKLEQAANVLNIWGAICEVLQWGRLYGGCVGVYLLDGQDVTQPLKIDRVGKGQFRGIAVLDRWMLEPDLQNLVTELGPDLGMPQYYRCNSDAPALRGKTIHYSRLFRVEGIRLPYWQRVMENLWGISVLERLYDRMVSFDSATTGAAQLVYKSHLRTLKVDKLRDLLATGGKAELNLTRYVSMMRRFQGIEGITVIDGLDEFTADGTGATVQSGIAEALVQFGQQLSGALQIPLVRLFGQSPAGLNSTGDADLITYYDGIKQQQERTLRVPVMKVYRLMALSEGVKLDDKFNFQFRPLWQMKDAERSEVDSRDTAAVLDAYDRGLVPEKTALEELRQRGRATNRWQNITDKMIESANDEVEVPDAEGLGLLPDGSPAPQPSPSGGGGAAKPNGKAAPSGGDLNKTVDAYPPGPGERCFACDKPLGSTPYLIGCKDDQTAYVGIECYRRIKAGGESGFQPPKGGPRLYLIQYTKHAVRDSLPISQVCGIDIAIEAAKGSQRWSGGPALTADYGYIRRTPSAEGPHEWMDCFLGPIRTSNQAFVVDMVRRDDGAFDEHKIMLGFETKEDAAAVIDCEYRALGIKPGTITRVSIPALRLWLGAGNVAAPFVPVNPDGFPQRTSA